MSCHGEGINKKDDQINDYFNQHLTPHSTSPKDKYLKDRIFQLYGHSGDMQDAMDEDRARFKKASDQAGLKLYANPEDEPVAKMSRFYGTDLDLRRAAAEFDMASDDLMAKLTENEEGSKNPVLHHLYSFLSHAGGLVRRDYIEANFGDILTALFGEAQNPSDPFEGKATFVDHVCDANGECLERVGSSLIFAGAPVASQLDYSHTYLDINDSGQWVALVSQSLFTGNKANPNETGQHKVESFPAELKTGAARIRADGRWVAVTSDTIFRGAATSHTVSSSPLAVRLKKIAVDLDANGIWHLTGLAEDDTLYRQDYTQ
jgi:hypothetical protein